MSFIYHVCRLDEWDSAVKFGFYSGSSQDTGDGFIHFSSKEQVVSSVTKHRTGQDNLVMLAVDPQTLGDALKWEPTKKGELFPHLYGTLPLHAVKNIFPLSLGPDGLHRFPINY